MASSPLPIPRLDKTLVIGGCGFLGHHIVKQLISSGSSSISVLDLRTTRNRVEGVTYYDGDITSSSSVDTILSQAKPEIIIHTASPVGSASVPHSVYEKVNIDGTKTLLECAGKSSTVKVFVFTSSASIIHDGISDQFDADETWPVLGLPAQKDYYAYTKGVADDAVLQANRKHGDMLTCCIRPAGIFGEGDAQLIPSTMTVLREGKTNFQLGDNTNRFDFTYVGNVAFAHLLAANALLYTTTMKTPPLEHERVDGEAFFVTNDEPLPFWDFMRGIWTTGGWQATAPWVIGKELGLMLAVFLEWVVWAFTLGKKEPTLTWKKVKFSCMNRTYNIAKAKKRLGYEPRTSLEEGIKRGVHWWLKEEEEKGQMFSSDKKND